jgi:hypothetical protein
VTIHEAMAGLRAAIDAKRNGPTHGDGAPVVVTLTSHPTGWSAEAVTVYGVRVLHVRDAGSAWGALSALAFLAETMEAGK